jgi:hypothetical protein
MEGQRQSTHLPFDERNSMLRATLYLTIIAILLSPGLATSSESDRRSFIGSIFFVSQYANKDIRTIEEHNDWVQVICEELKVEIDDRIASGKYEKQRRIVRRIDGDVSVEDNNGIYQCVYKEIYDIYEDRSIEYYSESKSLPSHVSKNVYGSKAGRNNFIRETKKKTDVIGRLIENVNGTLQGQAVNPIKHVFVFRYLGGDYEDIVVSYE